MIDERIAHLVSVTDRGDVIEFLTPERFSALWPAIEILLENEPEPLEGFDTIANVFESVMCGRYQAWAIGAPFRVELVMFTTMFDTPVGRKLVISGLWGKNLRKHLPVLAMQLRRYADEFECAIAQVIVLRPAMVRLMERAGFQMSGMMMQMDIERERAH